MHYAVIVTVAVTQFIKVIFENISRSLKSTTGGFISHRGVAMMVE